VRDRAENGHVGHAVAGAKSADVPVLRGQRAAPVADRDLADSKWDEPLDRPGRPDARREMAEQTANVPASREVRVSGPGRRWRGTAGGGAATEGEAGTGTLRRESSGAAVIPVGLAPTTSTGCGMLRWS
jgi:hypothetical protein